MRIQVSARIKRVYLVRGRYFIDRLWQPIIKDRNAKCFFHIKITDRNRQGVLIVQPGLAYGPDLGNINMGSRKDLSLEKEEHDFEWPFIPYETGRNEIRLHIKSKLGRDDNVFDDYNSLVYNKIYAKSFMVHSFFEYILFWFAGVSTLGAIAEIINMLVSLKILRI